MGSPFSANRFFYSANSLPFSAFFLGNPTGNFPQPPSVFGFEWNRMNTVSSHSSQWALLGKKSAIRSIHSTHTLISRCWSRNIIGWTSCQSNQHSYTSPTLRATFLFSLNTSQNPFLLYTDFCFFFLRSLTISTRFLSLLLPPFTVDQDRGLFLSPIIGFAGSLVDSMTFNFPALLQHRPFVCCEPQYGAIICLICN